jgi:hypothetical protein
MRVAVLTLALLATLARPGETPEPAPAASPSPSPAVAARRSPDPAASPAARPAGSPANRGEERRELEKFVPSEEVPADSAVAFPVDI